MSGIAGFDARGPVDASGVPIPASTLPAFVRDAVESNIADRKDKVKAINLLQSDVAGPQNCQQHDAD
jgi:hypothetical protein